MTPRAYVCQNHGVMSTYYIVKPGSQEPMGPMSAEQIRQGVMAGTITMDYCFSTPGATEWKPLAQLPGMNIGAASAVSPAMGGYPAGHRPDNYLIWSILVTLLCCWPIGIYAIIKSASVNGLWEQGKSTEARAAAEAAKKACIWSAVLGVVATVIYMMVVAAGA